MTPNEDGMISNQRLSGLMPFLACYFTSVPANNRIYLGEDRSDVLGLPKMQGQRRWQIGVDMGQALAFDLSIFGDPKVTFSHRNGRILDVDRQDETHNSDLIVNAGTPQQQRWVSHPQRVDAATAPPTSGWTPANK
jgi:hypothetical protein